MLSGFMQPLSIIEIPWICSIELKNRRKCLWKGKNMLKKNVLKYSRSLFDSTNYGFKFFKHGNLTILSTSFGVQLNFLLDGLKNYPIDKLSANLRKQQDRKTGLFIDNDFDIKQTMGFEEEYIFWQFTYFTTIALDMLGKKPQYSFIFLDDLKNKESLEKWLNKQDFKSFWYTSNKIMFLFYFLTYEQERLNIDNRVLIEYLFNFLDLRQDFNTGFWGTQNGASLENGMFGASHIYLFYDYYGKEINYKDKIIDNVIKLQNKFGLFGSKFGGACEDYDAIEILSILMKNSNYKFEVIKKTISKTYNTIIKNQNKDGGFSYRIDNRNVFNKIKNVINQKENTYKYSGWTRMKSNFFRSDIWGTYFRVLAIAKIEEMSNKKNKFRFYPLPGWGYF